MDRIPIVIPDSFFGIFSSKMITSYCSKRIKWLSVNYRLRDCRLMPDLHCGYSPGFPIRCVHTVRCYFHVLHSRFHPTRFSDCPALFQTYWLAPPIPNWIIQHRKITYLELQKWWFFYTMNKDIVFVKKYTVEMLNLRESHHSTHNIDISLMYLIITDCSPLSVIQDFNSTLRWWFSTNQMHLNFSNVFEN